MKKLQMRCGHQITVDIDKTPSPICWCGNAHVVRVLWKNAQASRPRITGHAAGPLVESKYLGPTAVPLAPKGALPLKEPTHAE